MRLQLIPSIVLCLFLFPANLASPVPLAPLEPRLSLGCLLYNPSAKCSAVGVTSGNELFTTPSLLNQQTLNVLEKTLPSTTPVTALTSALVDITGLSSLATSQLHLLMISLQSDASTDCQCIALSCYSTTLATYQASSSGLGSTAACAVEQRPRRQPATEIPLSSASTTSSSPTITAAQTSLRPLPSTQLALPVLRAWYQQSPKKKEHRSNPLASPNTLSSHTPTPPFQPSVSTSTATGGRHTPLYSHRHHHHSPRPRQRSASRSSSSPSPPPPALPSVGQAGTGAGPSSLANRPLSPRYNAAGLPRDKRRTWSRGDREREKDKDREKERERERGNGYKRSHGVTPVITPNGTHRAGYGLSEELVVDTAVGPGSFSNIPPESPFSALTSDTGFTSYQGSASSPGLGVSADEREDDDHYVFVRERDETETEDNRAGRRAVTRGGAAGAGGSGRNEGSAATGGSKLRRGSRRGSRPEPKVDADLPSRRMAQQPIHPLPAKSTLLPFTIGRVRITRRRWEDALVLGGVVLGVCRLLFGWGEYALGAEITLLAILSMTYTGLRSWPAPPRPPSPLPPSASPRPRSPSSSHAHHTHLHAPTRDRPVRPLPPSLDEDGAAVVPGAKGCIWGTEEREYRDCPDDGALFALLLGPMVASALLHAALEQLAGRPKSALFPGWIIESPLVLSSTPLRLGIPQDAATDALRALSALATSRRNLVQLFTLLSFVLLVQLARSLKHEHALTASLFRPPGGPVVTSCLIPGTPAQSIPLSPGMERDVSDSASKGQPGGAGTYWLKRGEWKRNLSVIAFAFIVTAGCVGVKIVTAIIGRGVWSDMSPSDIVIATLFYQFSLYVCVRLARRGFTLGELGVVSHAATALFMETVNMTRMKVRLLRTPYIKTYRLPTPLLTFQLALIPGSLLTGILLSPLLYLSRHLAQRPAHRLRFPHEKPMHRRLLALGFYAGALLVCGGVVGLWTQWCLTGRNPYVWVVMFLLNGNKVWTRPALIAYWGALAMISVAGWQRQLSRARRHRRYVVPSANGAAHGSGGNGHGGGNSMGLGITSASASGMATATPHSINTTSQSPPKATSIGSGSGSDAPPHPHSGSLSTATFATAATQMMDAADQRMPVLSVNGRRKFFHALAVVMFVPGIAFDPAFTHLSFSVAFAAFTFAEYVRYFALWPMGASVHLFLNEFIDHKDSGTAILSHFYLLAGCAAPLWLEGPCKILSYFGVLSLGVGDALASIIGRRIGHHRWSSASGKTLEGSLAFFLSVLVTSLILWVTHAADSFTPGAYTVTTALATVLEAVSAQNDNLILPMYGWALGVLLGV